MGFSIDKEKCVGCGVCAFTCLFGAISAEDDAAQHYEIDADKCIECSQCMNMCPKSAIAPPEGWKPIQSVHIIPEKCKGCSLCARVCKAGAPTGVVKEPFTIQDDKCFRCGLCASKCRFEAIEVTYTE